MGETPFTEVYLHATVRDMQGRKMSKSLGNGIDPLDVVDRFGADALRFTVLSAAAVGTDIRLDHENLEEAFAPGRNFANKVWNVGRFTLMTVGDEPVASLASVQDDLDLVDRWILTRLDRTTEAIDAALGKFRLHDVCEEVRSFFWGDLADWYVELVKPRLWGDEGERTREVARTVLVTVLDRILRLMHPLVPFVTSALWDRLPWPQVEGAEQERPADLMVAPWPVCDRGSRDPAAEAPIETLKELVTTTRSLRKEYGVREGEGVTLSLHAEDPAFREAVDGQSRQLERLAKVTEVNWDRPAAGTIGAHAVLTTGEELFLPLEGVVDLAAESARLRGEIAQVEGRLTGTRKKLDNEKFTQRAPAEIVQAERDKLEQLVEQVTRMRAKLDLLEGRG
jgi:valyl-tRNA synthetase